MAEGENKHHEMVKFNQAGKQEKVDYDTTYDQIALIKSAHPDIENYFTAYSEETIDHKNIPDDKLEPLIKLFFLRYALMEERVRRLINIMSLYEEQLSVDPKRAQEVAKAMGLENYIDIFKGLNPEVLKGTQRILIRRLYKSTPLSLDLQASATILSLEKKRREDGRQDLLTEKQRVAATNRIDALFGSIDKNDKMKKRRHFDAKDEKSSRKTKKLRWDERWDMDLAYGLDPNIIEMEF